MLVDANRLLDVFDLLDDLRRLAGVVEFAAALGALAQRIVPDGIDFVGLERGSDMFNVSLLPARLPFAASFRFRAVGLLFNDIARRRLRRGGRIFFRCVQLSFEFIDSRKEPLDKLLQFHDFPILGVHAFNYRRLAQSRNTTCGGYKNRRERLRIIRVVISIRSEMRRDGR